MGETSFVQACLVNELFSGSIEKVWAWWEKNEIVKSHFQQINRSWLQSLLNASNNKTKKSESLLNYCNQWQSHPLLCGSLEYWTKIPFLPTSSIRTDFIEQISHKTGISAGIVT